MAINHPLYFCLFDRYWLFVSIAILTKAVPDLSFDTSVKRFVKGVKIEIPDLDVIVPMISLGALENLEDDIKRLDLPETAPKERQSIMLSIVVAALGRHYPDIAVGDVVTNFTAEDILTAVRGALGIKEDLTVAAKESTGLAAGE